MTSDRKKQQEQNEKYNKQKRRRNINTEKADPGTDPVDFSEEFLCVSDLVPVGSF